jgi:hypothetical protein
MISRVRGGGPLRRRGAVVGQPGATPGACSSGPAFAGRAGDRHGLITHPSGPAGGRAALAPVRAPVSASGNHGRVVRPGGLLELLDDALLLDGLAGLRVLSSSRRRCAGDDHRSRDNHVRDHRRDRCRRPAQRPPTLPDVRIAVGRHGRPRTPALLPRRCGAELENGAAADPSPSWPGRHTGVVSRGRAYSVRGQSSPCRSRRESTRTSSRPGTEHRHDVGPHHARQSQHHADYR